jgi:hypothetical protein
MFRPIRFVWLRTIALSCKDNVCVDADIEKRKPKTAARSPALETEIFFIVQTPQKVE